VARWPLPDIEAACASNCRTGSAQTRTVTISAGVASRLIGGRDQAEQLPRDADAALYQAKRGGRNCVRRFAAAVKPVE
jgi:PleD family two-component response regulator